MEPESKFDTQKNLLSLAFQSINIVLIDHHFSKNLKIDETGGGLKKRSQAVSCSHSYYKFLSLHVWNDHPLPFNK